MSRIPTLTIETASDDARQRLETATAANGFLPNPLGLLANAPAALEAYLTLSQMNAKASLTLAEREVVQITAAATHDCGFCVAGHTGAAPKLDKGRGRETSCRRATPRSQAGGRADLHQGDYSHTRRDLERGAHRPQGCPLFGRSRPGNRSFFVEESIVALTAGPDAVHTLANFGRPFVDGGPLLEAVRVQLALKATKLAKIAVAA